MQSCGRIRKHISNGWTQLINGELQYLEVGVLKLDRGQTHFLNTGDREWAIVLVQGECSATMGSGSVVNLGLRSDPFLEMPWALFISRDESVTVTAKGDCLLGVGSAPMKERTANSVVMPDQVVTAIRGTDNWTREVRKVCWSDNTDGYQLLVSETCTPSGNWSTMPPHRHQNDVPGEEAPYEEAYYFRFSRPEGFGLIWQFDDETGMDQAFSLKSNDAVFIGHGYHPVVCAPGATLYHLTFMAGPRRQSMASIHPDYQFLLNEKGLPNQFTQSR